MTETQCAIIILVTVSVSTFFAAHTHQSDPTNPTLRSHVFRHLMIGFVFLAALFVGLSVYEAIEGPASVGAALGFAGFVSLPCLLLAALPSFLTGFLVEKWASIRPNNLRIEAPLIAPALFSVLLYGVIALWGA